MRCFPVTAEDGIAANTTWTYSFTAAEAIQKQGTFKVDNGTWVDRTTTDIVLYVDLKDIDDRWSADGSGTLTVPCSMKPTVGYIGGARDVAPPTTIPSHV